MQDVSYVRFLIGRAVIHFGIRLLPKGRVRSELTVILDEWATRVYLKIGKM